MKKANLLFLLSILTACAEEPPPIAAVYVPEEFYDSALFWADEVEIIADIYIADTKVPDAPGLWIYRGHDTIWYSYERRKCNIRQASVHVDGAFVWASLSMLLSDDSIPLQVGTAMPPDGEPPYYYLNEEQKHKLRKHWQIMQDDCSSMFSIL